MLKLLTILFFISCNNVLETKPTNIPYVNKEGYVVIDSVEVTEYGNFKIDSIQDGLGTYDFEHSEIKEK